MFKLVCPGPYDTNPYVFNLSNTTKDHSKVYFLWDEKYCNSSCHPGSCIFHFEAPKEYQIMAEFLLVNLAFGRTQEEYLYADFVNISCFDADEDLSLFSTTTQGVLNVPPIWCLGNLLTLEIYAWDKNGKNKC